MRLRRIQDLRNQFLQLMRFRKIQDLRNQFLHLLKLRKIQNLSNQFLELTKIKIISMTRILFIMSINQQKKNVYVFHQIALQTY